MSLHPEFDAPAQQWIDAGLAVRTEKGADKNFAKMAFVEAQANQFLHLTGKGAIALDREAKGRKPPSPN
ncbi:MAG: hypothetical protein ACJ74Y_15170 [Bryobacteraceae bacterium]